MHTVLAVLLLTARFYSAGDVPAGDRGVASDVASHILRGAGIELHTVDCSGALVASEGSVNTTCLNPIATDEVIVRFVSSPALTMRRSAHDVLGDAYVDTAVGVGSLATVYVDRVEAMSRTAGVDAATLLGRVTAHEIGHLLMGNIAHQPSGLMRAEWSTTILQRGFPNDWRFSRADATSVRAGLVRRAAVGSPAARFNSSATLPCPTVETSAPVGATCPSCPVCEMLPADRVALSLLIEPRF